MTNVIQGNFGKKEVKEQTEEYVVNQTNRPLVDLEQLLGQERNLKNNMDRIKAELDETKKQIEDLMKAKGIKSYQGEGVKVTYVPESVKNRFNSAQFKKAMPEAYKQFTVESHSKGFVKITWK